MYETLSGGPPLQTPAPVLTASGFEDGQMQGTILNAVQDIRSGIRMRSVWIELAREDIGDQHRRTTLGPFWLLVNYLAFAGTFVFVFRRGGAGMENYGAYVATGLFVWFYIMETITQSVSLFIREESFIKGTTLPLSVYVLRLVMQCTIRAGYALVGCIGILLLSGIEFGLGWLWAVVGIVVVLAVSPAAIMISAFLGVYFPDSQFIVSNFMRIGMFLTPVFWTYEESTPVRHLFYYWNPFTYFLEIVRQPILSGGLPLYELGICVAIGLVLWAVALLLLGRLGKQVAFHI
ncbi:ABC transporter permease [Nitratireductor aquibiodomus]|nr:ABC transporter permease [Nitratireductor aquibiodomus]